jgi:hypothetical protein
MPPRLAPLLLASVLLPACDFDPSDDEKAAATGDRDILAIGDSFLDHHGEGVDLPWVVARSLGYTVESAAMGGTTMLGGEGVDIPDQYVDGDFLLLLASGGGNDLATCTCGLDCAPTLDALISEDASSGAVPELVARAVDGGAKVAWVGYLRPLPSAEEFGDCDAELNTYQKRLALLDAAEPNMVFIDGTEYGTGEDLYEADGYHPSPEGSTILGAVVASTVAEEFGL